MAGGWNASGVGGFLLFQGSRKSCMSVVLKGYLMSFTRRHMIFGRHTVLVLVVACLASIPSIATVGLDGI